MSLKSVLTSLGDAVRNLTGGTSLLSLEGMTTALNSIVKRTESDIAVSGATVTIPAGCYKNAISKTISATGEDIVIQSLTVTSNGTYTASAGVDGYSPITVNVSSEDGFTLPTIEEDALGTASDLAESKQLIGADGNIVTGVLIEVPTGSAIFGTHDHQVGGTEGDTTFNVAAVWDALEDGVILRSGARPGVRNVPTSLLGDAELSDVAKGKTFTSAAGYLAEGTMEPGITPSGSLDITENGTFDVTNYASVNVNVPTESSGHQSGDIVKAFEASAILASGYNVSSVSASNSVKQDSSGVVSLSGATSTVDIGSIDNVKGRYVKATSGSVYFVPDYATITQSGPTYNPTYTADKANLMFVLA